MASISEEGRGSFTYISTPQLIQPAFAVVLGGLLSIALQKVQLKISLPPTLTAARITAVFSGGRAAPVDSAAASGGAWSVDLGEMFATESRCADGARGGGDFVLPLKRSRPSPHCTYIYSSRPVVSPSLPLPSPLFCAGTSLLRWTCPPTRTRRPRSPQPSPS